MVGGRRRPTNYKSHLKHGGAAIGGERRGSDVSEIKKAHDRLRLSEENLKRGSRQGEGGGAAR